MASPAPILLDLLAERWSRVDNACGAGARLDDAFVDLAAECDVQPTVHWLLEREGRLDLLEATARERLERRRHKCRMDNLLLLARLEEALSLLEGAGLGAVALKGLDVIHRFDLPFDARTLDDIDLLLPAAEIPRAIEALEAAGWQVPVGTEREHWLRSSHHLPTSSPGPVEVHLELHWNLVQESRYRLDAAELLQRSEPIEIAGRRIRRLEDHDFVAHLFLHHLSHYFDRRLKWLLDLRRVSRGEGFRWERVVERLERWQGAVAGGMVAWHLDRIDPDLLPAGVRRRLPVRWWRRLAVWPLRSTHPLELFRGTRRRAVQLYLAAACLERLTSLPSYLRHRAARASTSGSSAVERADGRGEERR